MIKNYTDTGNYKVKDTGEVVNYTFDFVQVESVEDFTELEGGIAQAISLVNRMLKVDSNNKTREKTKSANGHSSTAPLTAEEKLRRKETRAKDRDILKALKGLDPEQLQALGISL